MKRGKRFLSMAVVVSMIAVLPASAQSIPAFGDDSNLSLLVSINRLELSEDQMVELHDILSSLLATKGELEAAREAFEQVMVKFSGTSEELDELLVSFRENQAAQIESMREATAESLDAVGDLLTINQGKVLRDELPELLGLGGQQTAGVGALRLQEMPSAMMQRMSGNSMGRREMMSVWGESSLPDAIEPAADGLCETSGIQSAGQSGYWNEVSSSTIPVDAVSVFGLRGMQSSAQPSLTSRMMQSSAERDLMLRGMQTGQWPDLSSSTMENRGERLVMLRMLQDRSSSGLPEMIQQQLGQFYEDEVVGEEMPDAVRERLEHRMSGRLSLGDQPAMVMRGQVSLGLRQTDRGYLFDLLENIVEVLELKLEALE